LTLVKVCGICDAASAAAAVEAGADLLGFHFCPSPRLVTAREACAIVESLEHRPEIVGVFIDSSPEEISAIADVVGLDRVQLHGSEPPGYAAPRPPIKVLKVRDGVIPDAEDWPDPVLLDSWSSDQRGGTGRAWDWERARPLLASRQVIVAGGLKLGDLAASVRAVRAYQLLPDAAAQLIGAGLPLVEVVLGVLLVIGLGTRAAAGISVLLLSAFVVGISAAWARGLQIDCGCFGSGGQLGPGERPTYGWELVRDVGVLALAGLLAWRPRSRLAADRWLIGTDEAQER